MAAFMTKIIKSKTVSETTTENIFRNFYGSQTFIEKSAIPKSYGFTSKKGTSYDGYPDFFKDMTDFAIIVEAKALKHSDAENEIQFYMANNNIKKGVVGMAISGQDLSQIKVTYYFKKADSDKIEMFQMRDKLLSIENIKITYQKKIVGDTISDEDLTKIIKLLNEDFQKNGVKESYRSLFFSGILIALRNDEFRTTYKSTQPPSKTEIATTGVTLLESHNLNKKLLDAIDIELKGKVNNLSKEFSWKDAFAFIKNIEFSLQNYISVISTIETKIYYPFINDEKRDVLGKAYKLFLSRAGKAENKNIILTPDHIKSLMIKLARLEIDDVVLDTCMGTGGFLMEALEVLTNYAGDDEDKISDICNKQLIGFENDSTLFALACSNMFLHGDGRSNLLFRSSLLRDDRESLANNNDEILFNYIKEQKPRKCIINPPYEQDNPIKFVKQALEYIEPYGKLIIIMPTPTLTKHQKNGGMTHDILKKAKLDFVIKMPYNLFSEQGRSVNTSIFGFTKTPHHKSDNTLFYNLETDEFVSIQHKGRIDVYNRWNDIENSLLDTINNMHEIKGISQLMKIYKGNNLNCSGWRDVRDSKHHLVPFSTLFSYVDGTLASTKNIDDGEYDFITASDERKKHNEYTHDCEALVYAISSAGSLGKSQYVKGKFVASNLCLVLTPNKDNEKEYPINLQFYNWYLESIRKQLVADLADGTSKLTIRDTDLANYYIEYIPLEEQNRFVDDYVKPFNDLQHSVSIAESKLKDRLMEIL
ncbi:N-6 DNA methylase [Fibrobacter sp.]|uniref:N-6 DNA methylase n=1 Tax=Fibrobacter sp. TaxID=35828 RepID=UPI00388F0007